MIASSVPSGAAVTLARVGQGRLFSVLVTTAGTGTGNTTISDGYGYSDLAIDSVNPNKVTSASHSFVAADVGLPFTVVSGTGFTAGALKIVSVSSGAAILSGPAGTVSSTSGTYTVGSGLTIFSLPATVAVNTYYSLIPYGSPYATLLQATNVSSGPVLTLVYD